MNEMRYTIVYSSNDSVINLHFFYFFQEVWHQIQKGTEIPQKAHFDFYI